MPGIGKTECCLFRLNILAQRADFTIPLRDREWKSSAPAAWAVGEAL